MAKLSGATICVTGGAGFIGSHIVDQALALGAARVVVVDDLVRGRLENLEGARRRGRVDVLLRDISEPGVADTAIDGCDLVFHQAALRITHCAAEPQRAVQVMVSGTQLVLDACVRHKVEKVLAASSASVYGEPRYLPVDEDAPFDNRTLYGAAKIGNEQMLRSYNEMFGLRYLMMRPFNVYGPRMDIYGAYTEVLIRWLDRLEQNAAPVIFGDGLQTLDFINVRDVARAYILAALSDHDDRVYNVGSGEETSLRALCQMLCNETGHPEIEPEFQPARAVNPIATRRRAAIERIRADLGWQPEITLRDGLRELIGWHAGASKVLAVAK
jgi:UDP-glucose 4-epimerase